MRRDPIVEEVRRNREAIAREYGNNVDAIVAAFQRDEAITGVTTVSFPPKHLVKRATRKSGKTRRPNKALQPSSRARRASSQSKRRRRAARG